MGEWPTHETTSKKRAANVEGDDLEEAAVDRIWQFRAIPSYTTVTTPSPRPTSVG